MPKPRSSSSSSDSGEPQMVNRATTGATRNPPLSPPRAIFMQPMRGQDSDEELSAPNTPNQANPFGTPAGSIIDGPPLSPASRVQSSSSFGYFPQPDIAMRSSGILSVGGAAGNPFSSGRSQVSGLSAVSSMADITEGTRQPLSRAPSSMMREAFTSPPPRPVTFSQAASRHQSVTNLNRGQPKRLKSTMLTGEIDKPWRSRKDNSIKIAYWLTYGVAFLGIVASALRCYFGYMSVPQFKHPLCQVMNDDFDTFDTTAWTHEVQLDGFGNGEFEMTTDSSNNSYVKDGKLYLMPTLTSDVIGSDAIFDGHMYNLTDCTGANYTSCGLVSNRSTGAVIPPVMSARISTRLSHSIRFGRVEVVAKIPRGDWLWPAIWMLPTDPKYGAWPASGEIDIMEARGNGPSYPKQGNNYVRGSLNWGPSSFLNAVSKTYGWWNMRRASYDQAFHTYALEWTEDWLRIYVDSRLHHMIDMRFNEPFWKRGEFPTVIQNGSNSAVLQDPWTNSPNKTVTNAAPFDQDFYLILNVAAGGTNGWFPDNAGGKPWLDQSASAMRDFAIDQPNWYKSWPQGDQIEDRAMIVDSVKMWTEC